ncbi:MAG: ImmA/IrrE family metallo-endopeptidase [Acidimicrobiaceae bacterium]|nr:ImmA/IrrE family metallo-endopeptidase [Acidimicrobiaceae bacterium]MXZ97563.1 ImmA/IrrE family metallo-endopeptidase [Acidimicrobiaceae bacterium]MYE75186.1 ImmA/IrrE family metallo-endopeptidase [Acidimicrobiaceae bacterium]MYE96132.1 ImmA/IrrE family metallo-endopeptidase [Acidimicrobiaceae bacterium]MYI54181.1 ImmA/IrrE family metallo-endopeptidase [Acidimicrobiaceae bacterium]
MLQSGAMELSSRIAEARELAGLTQEQVSAATGLGRTVIAKIEAGTRRLAATELVVFAEVLDRPVDWFFRVSPPAVVSRRSDPAVGGQSRALDSRVERIARDIDFLLDEGELPQVTRTMLDPPSSVEASEDAAAELRGRLGVEEGPLLGLQRCAERAGLFAFSLDLGDGGGDAAYVAVGDAGVAVINGALEPGRRRFNLAHELGHHVFQDAYAPEVGLSPQDDNERLINAFAIHLLLPRRDTELVASEFERDLRLAAVAAAVRFRLSWTAVCAQLRNVGVIDAGTREDLANHPPSRADFIELGERWVAELDPPCVPPLYGRRVLAAYRRGKLTEARAAELLWGTVNRWELPAQDEVPLEAWRREFEPLA